MRRILRVGAAVLALLVAANAAEAQGGGGARGGGGRGDPAQMLQRQIDARMEGITLSDAQKATIDSLSKVMVTEQTKARESMGAGGDMQAMREKMMELNTKFYADVRGVLTTEQQAKFDENVKNLPPAGGRGRGGF